jgi:hypothetical protein
MAEQHRPVLDPAVARRVGESMGVFADAWQGDIDELRRVETELADTQRLLNAATDRANDLQGDLRTVRQENADLIKRNAHLEAQVQSLYEKSLDAKDALGHLAERAVESARSAPPVLAWRDPEKNPPGEQDAPPAFMRAAPAGPAFPSTNSSAPPNSRTVYELCRRTSRSTKFSARPIDALAEVLRLEASAGLFPV